MYRQELEVKLLTTDEIISDKSIEFNLMGLVETDEKTKSESIKTQFNVGAISPNEVAKMYHLPTAEGGDKRFIPVNLQELKKDMTPLRVEPTKPIKKDE
jgi:hypothetical protein